MAGFLAAAGLIGGAASAAGHGLADSHKRAGDVGGADVVFQTATADNVFCLEHHCGFHFRRVNATLYLYPGPESEPIRAAAVKKLEAYITAQHRLGRDIRLSAIYAALHVEGVQRVELTAPLADIVLNSTQASFCTEYRVVTGGSDE